MNKIKVGVYLHNDTPKKRRTSYRLKSLLAKDSNIESRSFYAEDIRKGCLEDVQAVLFPGGTSRGQSKKLGKEGRKAVRKFVMAGGGYIGICAGAWLARRNPHLRRGKPLGMVNATSSAAYVRNGRRKYVWGSQRKVEIRFTEDANEVFGELAYEGNVIKPYYHNGPMIAHPKNPDPTLPRYTTLATFVEDCDTTKKHKAPVKDGAGAIISAKYGKGRIILVSPHLERERTPDFHPLIRRAVEWTGGN